MKKLALVLVVAVIASASTIAIASSRQQEPQRVAATSPKQTLKKLDRKMDHVAQVRRVNCGTLACINNTLTRQASAIKNLRRNLNTLWNDYYNCELLAEVSQYGDFAAFAGGSTTGLDFGSGGSQDMWVVHYVC